MIVFFPAYRRVQGRECSVELDPASTVSYYLPINRDEKKLRDEKTSMSRVDNLEKIRNLYARLKSWSYAMCKDIDDFPTLAPYIIIIIALHPIGLDYTSRKIEYSRLK